MSDIFMTLLGKQTRNTNRKAIRLTTMSFPAFSSLFPTFIAAAAAAPDEIPTYNKHAVTFTKELEKPKRQAAKAVLILSV